jgi:DDB1- and CUL4-associated factor 8
LRYSHITGVRYSKNGDKILASYSENNIYLFDVNEQLNQEHDSKTVTKFENLFSGHRNVRTVKEVNFFGPRDEFVISGSDCGSIFFWEREKNEIIQIVKGDKHIVNCLSPHPNSIPVLATSGIENDVKIWTPTDFDGKCSKINEKELIAQNNETSSNDGTIMTNRMVLDLLQMMAERRNDPDRFEGFEGFEEEEEDEENRNCNLM